MNLTTTYIYPPVPFRSHDWCAYDADDEGEGPTGYGETEVEALKDFIMEALDHYEGLAYAEGRKDEREDIRKQELEADYEMRERVRMDIQDMRAEMNFKD